jgi:hypothetical protein
MKRLLLTVCALAVVWSLTSHSHSVSWAKKPGGGGGGGDNANTAYTIIDLPGPYHQVRGWSQTYAERIADADGNGTVYVLGRFVDGAYGAIIPRCVWTLAATGVSAEDITGLLDTPRDINSAGIVAGQKDQRPALLLPNGETVYLADQGHATAMNNPDDAGVFQVVGNQGTGADVVWDVAVDGTILLTTSLTDPGGRSFRADDINQAGVMGGAHWDSDNLVSIPAIGSFDENGHLQLVLLDNPNPSEIDGFWEFQIDDGGNLLGDGYKLGTDGFFARAVIWPNDGGAIEIAAPSGVTKAEGNGIALVNGVIQAVGGASDDRSWYAYVYTNHQLTALEPISDGEQSWKLSFARDINASGMICGQGRVGSRRKFEEHGFLLSPK